MFDQSESGVVDNTEFHKLDIINKEQVLDIITDIQPDAVVNVAAISNIDFEERNEGLTRTVNVENPKNIAEACGRIDCRLVHFSSDAVFTGTEDIYREEDSPAPVNYYGRSKAESEVVVASE